MEANFISIMGRVDEQSRTTALEARARKRLVFIPIIVECVVVVVRSTTTAACCCCSNNKRVTSVCGSSSSSRSLAVG